MEQVAELAGQGPWVFISVLLALACGALWRQNNRLNDTIRDDSERAQEELRALMVKTLEGNAAVQMAMQVNAQALSALERAFAHGERGK